MSLTYTTQHYEWQQRVNKELYYSMKFDRFYNSNNKTYRNLPNLKRNSTPSIASQYSERSIVVQSRQSEKRPSTRGTNFSKITHASEVPVEKQENSTMKTYIKELENQLRQEKMKRIKSEEMLKRYTSQGKYIRNT
ncbi:hypothetical protein SteCoe_5034 [Stentor coeruleus]|uniref:Uncharacterized protein n=1 Tax=Stentor coeruleus TaxID=5963 RepID=A0A1R2CTF5_9CILI|nr:hypothetical protein SteCoe_5034 [Stentor coeruleus]